MSVHRTKFDLHKEALEETLEAVKILINYDKEPFSEKWNKSSGCLGYPAATLLFSYINAFGNLFYDNLVNKIRISSDTRTFQILNTNYFENQNLAPETLDRLYDIYRSKLVHNLSLPENYFLKIKSSTTCWYETSINSLNKEVISTIYIQDLYELCINAYEKLKKEHLDQYNSSKKIIYMANKDLANNSTIQSFNSSGVTSMD